MRPTPGQKIYSTICAVQVVVVKGADGDIAVTCGGEPTAVGQDPADRASTTSSQLADSPRLGKRYVDEPSGLEVLCVREGLYALAVDGRPMTIKGAKVLPSSD